MLFNGEYSLYEYKKDNDKSYSKHFIVPEKQQKKLSSEITNRIENNKIKSKERDEVLNSYPVYKLNEDKKFISNSKNILPESLKKNKLFLNNDNNDLVEDNNQDFVKDLDVTIQDMFLEIIDDKFANEKLKETNKRQSLVETIKTNKINIKDDEESNQNKKHKITVANDMNDTNPISFSTKQNTENIKKFDSKTNSLKNHQVSNKKRNSIIDHIELLEKDLNKMSVIHEENQNLESSHLMATKNQENKKDAVDISRNLNTNKDENENNEKQRINVNKKIVKIEKTNIKEILNREYDYLYKMYYQVDKNIFDKNLAIKLYNNIVNKASHKSKHLTKILKDFKFNKINHSQLNKETKVINGPKFVIQMCQQLISEINVLKNLENVSLPSLIYYILGKCMINVLSSNLFSYMKASIDEVIFLFIRYQIL